MSISKKVIVSLVVIGSVTQLLSLQSIQAQEANEPNVTNITANMPRNGWVEMDDNGKVVDTNLYDEMDDDTAIDSGYSGFRTAINYPFGRWVYYVDTFPFAPWARLVTQILTIIDSIIVLQLVLTTDFGIQHTLMQTSTVMPRLKDLAMAQHTPSTIGKIFRLNFFKKATSHLLLVALLFF